MHTANEITLRLAIIDDSAENAEALVSLLRNSGIAVRPQRPTSTAELAQLLAGQPIDLVLMAEGQGLDPVSAAGVIAASGKDVPLILLADALDETRLVAAMSNGVRGVALRKHPEHTLSVIRREFTDLQARRGMRRIESQMRETERRCDALIASSREPIAYVHEGMHIRANDAYLEMFGYDGFEDIEGISLLDMVAPQYVDDFKALLKSLSKGEAPPPQYQLDACNVDGELFPATMEFTGATYEGEQCLQVIFRRRSDIVDPDLAREVEALRQRDQVTGLLNRPTFMLQLEQALAEVSRSDHQYGFLLVQPDHYARLLPEFGLDEADALIAALADVLSATVGDQAQLGRLGENNFAVLARGNWEQTNALARRITGAFASQVVGVGSRSASVTVSIGGVQIGEKISGIPQVLSRATECLGSATALGGNDIQLFDPAAVDRAEVERVQRWLLLLEQAISGDGFVLHYQPVLSLMGEPTERYDAFLRLDNNGELVPPANFIGLAEEHGLLARINCWVVRQAIRVMGQRKRAGHDTHITVRVGPESFNDPQYLLTISQELAQQGVEGRQLSLQVSEAKVYTSLRAAQQFLADVSQYGCQVVMDQFGSGLDSAQLLSHFHPAFIKLDRSFTAEYSQVREQQEKIEAIASRATELGIHTVAEFVADAQSMSQLFTAGVHYVQGDFVGPVQAQMDFEFG
ncbi:membrane protein [Stenotrophomonas ginsengisoli]|uniref:Membrane protein n=1 Tax=Stenotrophomonas ginsengisoli TaxID=336566 RepID=A0A0R0D785_9GAMM|nr:EAL domain-containing protein [Stenotrophomonas ginsengisoli]KRG78124.1 membrane protein [Stenotrophomonas ginsengisoli]